MTKQPSIVQRMEAKRQHKPEENYKPIRDRSHSAAPLNAREQIRSKIQDLDTLNDEVAKDQLRKNI